MTWDDDKVSALYYRFETAVPESLAGIAPDLSTGTPVIDMGGTVLAMTWDGPQSSQTAWSKATDEYVTTYRRWAHTDDALAGAAVTAAPGLTVLTEGKHLCEPKLITGTTVTPGRQFTIEAKAPAAP